MELPPITVNLDRGHFDDVATVKREAQVVAEKLRTRTLAVISGTDNELVSIEVLSLRRFRSNFMPHEHRENIENLGYKVTISFDGIEEEATLCMEYGRFAGEPRVPFAGQLDELLKLMVKWLRQRANDFMSLAEKFERQPELAPA